MHVLSTVAERHHLGSAVYTRPYALTLFEFLTLRERDRIDEIIADSEQIAAAGRQAIAFHEPGKLQQEFDRVSLRAGTMPTREEALADGEKLLERIAAIRANAPKGSPLLTAGEG